MPTPAEIQDFLVRFNEQVGNLSQTNSRIFFFREFWNNLTGAQQTGVKNLVTNEIDDVIAELNTLKTEIQGF